MFNFFLFKEFLFFSRVYLIYFWSGDRVVVEGLGEIDVGFCSFGYLGFLFLFKLKGVCVFFWLGKVVNGCFLFVWSVLKSFIYSRGKGFCLYLCWWKEVLCFVWFNDVGSLRFKVWCVFCVSVIGRRFWKFLNDCFGSFIYEWVFT